MSLVRYLPLEWRRQRSLRRTPAGPLHDYLTHAFPARDQDYRQSTFLAVDLETTGFDCKKDHILSIGSVEIRGDMIDLGTARHVIVSSNQELAEANVAIHRLTDDIVARGEPIATALAELLRQLSGKVLLAHHADIEVGFLRIACRDIFGGEFIAPVIDTLALAQQQIRRRDEIVSRSALRLAALREQYHLPRYHAHNALSDAIAAAELFLAQAAERSGRQANLPLKSLLTKQ